MCKILFALLAVAGFATATYAQENQNMDKAGSGNRMLVAYFSVTGTTARAAELLAEATGGELYAITPAQPYSSADLDWNDKRSRCSVEMNDPEARPALGGEKLRAAPYDVVFIGYPIWWNLAPRIVESFIENSDLDGKIIVPFATSGGSGISNSVASLKRAYPDLKWKEGKLLNRADLKTIREWVATLAD